MASASLFTLLALCFFNFLIISLSSHTVPANGDHQHTLGWVPTRSGCRGTVAAECMASEEEFELDSESSRRLLASSRYISYGAMQRNNVPCSQRGASYYNCGLGAQANPYSRGCSAITRCRS